MRTDDWEKPNVAQTGPGNAGGASAVRFLWITWIDPSPERDGQRLYTGRLIEAVAQAGAAIDVLCFESETSGSREAESSEAVRWHTQRHVRRPGWLSPFSSLPNVAYRGRTAAMRQALRRLLREERWDAVILDGLAAGWAVPYLEEIPRRDRPRIVHISHNHETTTRGAVARNYRGNPLMRIALKRDAEKTRRLEERLLGTADRVTAITEDDADKFSETRPDTPVSVLTPGYGGRRVPCRTITEYTPRLVVIVGSFHWVAKKMNLESFLAAADPMFVRAGVRLKIVGSGDPAFLDALRNRMKATEVIGAVDDVMPYLNEARIAIVPELTGGGFKLKILDYVFNRVPIAAMSGSLAGTPLRHPTSTRMYDSFDALARGVVETIDDLDTLNAVQNEAYEECVDRFDWDKRGLEFVRISTAA